MPLNPLNLSATWFATTTARLFFLASSRSSMPQPDQLGAPHGHVRAVLMAAAAVGRG